MTATADGYLLLTAGGGPELADRTPRILIVDDERHNRELLEVTPL